jgi:ATP-binding cassette subfamily F protein uup
VKAAAQAPKDKPQKLSWKETKELEGMEATIAEAEAKQVALEGKLADPLFFATPGPHVQETINAAEAQRKAVQALYQRWESLMERA